jgi:CheY-like chemotaxis protein
MPWPRGDGARRGIGGPMPASGKLGRAATFAGMPPAPATGMSSAPEVVAIFNTNDDTVELLRTAVENAGLVAVSGHIQDVRRGKLDLEEFIQTHKPRVIIYDLAPPYDRAWMFLQHLRDLPALRPIHFVLTSANVAPLQELAGRDERIYEIIGKPYDIDQIVKAVKEASRARPTR